MRIAFTRCAYMLVGWTALMGQLLAIRAGRSGLAMNEFQRQSDRSSPILDLSNGLGTHTRSVGGFALNCHVPSHDHWCGGK